MKQKSSLTTIVLATIFLSLIWGVFLVFNSSMNTYMRHELVARLEEIVRPNIISFELQMNEQIKKVNTLAEFLGESGELGSPENIALLQSVAKNNGLLRCAIVFPDGNFVTHDFKNEGNVSQDKFFLENMKGNFYITDPRPAVVDSTKTVILFSAPIYKNEEIKGSVIYSYLCNSMDRIFNLNFMDEQGRMMVINQQGTLLIGNSEYVKNQENLLSVLREKCLHGDHEAEECLNFSMENGNYSLNFGNGTSNLLVRYDRLPFNDWVMVSMIPEEVGMKSLFYVIQNQRYLGIVIFAFSLIYISIIFVIWMVQHRNVDKMTGVLTIEGFKRKAKKMLHRTKEKSHVIIQMDVKNFKLINRMYDFTVGDKVIKNMADALIYTLKDLEAICARIGTDTFIFLIPYKGRDWLQDRRDTFVENFRYRMGNSFYSKVNFPTGQYLLVEKDYEKVDIVELIEKANFAHREAKQQYDVVSDYRDNIEKEALLEKKIEDRMNSALNDEEFVLYLQPKYRLSNEKICGAEALVRWKVGEEYFMYPTDFIPILERNGFIVQLDKYMFELAARKIKSLMDAGREPISISVNFSRHHLGNDALVQELCDIADKYQVPREYFEIEITESALYGDISQITELIQKLHKEHFTISMDDFGSGYSSLAQLIELNVDVLKIDKSFFSNESNLERTKIVVSNVLHMAQQLGIITVAEGVENENQVEMLRAMDCDIVQGFYYSKPIPSKDIDAMLKA